MSSSESPPKPEAEAKAKAKASPKPEAEAEVTSKDDNEEAELLEDAKRLFEAGNYLEAKKIAERLTKSADASIAERAARILERLSPAPLTRYLLALTFVLLLVVTFFAYL